MSIKLVVIIAERLHDSCFMHLVFIFLLPMTFYKLNKKIFKALYVTKSQAPSLCCSSSDMSCGTILVVSVALCCIITFFFIVLNVSRKQSVLK